MRRHTDLSHDQRLRIAESLLVPCDPPGPAGRHRGCGSPPGQRCRNVHTGLPLEGLGAHVGRLQRARAARRGPRPEPVPA